MKIRCRRKQNADLYENGFRNLLYEMVKMYGVYVEYQRQGVSDQIFKEYYRERKQAKYRYITIANRAARKYLWIKHDRMVMRLSQMRKILLSGKKSFVYTYDWLPEYVDFFISRISNDPTLRECVMEEILAECKECEGLKDESRILRYCQDVVLGFQYDFLCFLSEVDKGKRSETAKGILKSLSKYRSIENVIEMCPTVSNGGKNAIV